MNVPSEDALRITGLGMTGGFGSGRDAFAHALAQDCAPNGTLLPSGRPAYRADAAALDTFLPRRTTRRADPFARLALLGACLALSDAGIDSTPGQGEDMALVLATAHGATSSTLALQDGVIQDGDTCASPTHFANSLHNSATAQLSLLLGIQGPAVTITQGGLSVPSALLAARTLLRQRRVRRVLFGAVEELSEVSGLLWEGRPGVPGEGAVFMVLDPCSGTSCALLDELVFPATAPGVFEPTTYADCFGEGPMLAAFQLAAGIFQVASGTEESLRLRWDDPMEGCASCRISSKGV